MGDVRVVHFKQAGVLPVELMALALEPLSRTAGEGRAKRRVRARLFAKNQDLVPTRNREERPKVRSTL